MWWMLGGTDGRKSTADVHTGDPPGCPPEETYLVRQVSWLVGQRLCCQVFPAEIASDMNGSTARHLQLRVSPGIATLAHRIPS